MEQVRTIEIEPYIVTGADGTIYPTPRLKSMSVDELQKSFLMRLKNIIHLNTLALGADRASQLVRNAHSIWTDESSFILKELMERDEHMCDEARRIYDEARGKSC